MMIITVGRPAAGRRGRCGGQAGDNRLRLVRKLGLLVLDRARLEVGLVLAKVGLLEVVQLRVLLEGLVGWRRLLLLLRLLVHLLAARLLCLELAGIGLKWARLAQSLAGGRLRELVRLKLVLLVRGEQVRLVGAEGLLMLVLVKVLVRKG